MAKIRLRVGCYERGEEVMTGEMANGWASSLESGDLRTKLFCRAYSTVTIFWTIQEILSVRA